MCYRGTISFHILFKSFWGSIHFVNTVNSKSTLSFRQSVKLVFITSHSSRICMRGFTNKMYFRSVWSYLHMWHVIPFDTQIILTFSHPRQICSAVLYLFSSYPSRMISSKKSSKSIKGVSRKLHRWVEWNVCTLHIHIRV